MKVNLIGKRLKSRLPFIKWKPTFFPWIGADNRLSIKTIHKKR